MEVTFPYKWTPREYQMPFWLAMEGGKKRACVVWHRRVGKDLTALNFCGTQLAQRVGLYWHMLPTYRQGKRIVWDGMTREGRRFLDHFPGWSTAGEPGSFVTRKRDDEMSLWFANGSKYQVIGADDPDSLVGGNPVGIIFSEFAVYDSAKVWNLLRPILVENGGFAIFIFTPRGRNHAFRLLEAAKKSERWFSEVLTVDDTGIVSEEDIQYERDDGMPESEVQQEFYCSFDAPLVGAYYGDLMTQAEKDGRITTVPWEMNHPVTTFWDLGMRDATCIWFYQRVAGQHRMIDFLYSSDVGLDHYVRLLKEKKYIYERHLVPHDAKVRELGVRDGRARIDSARLLGLNMELVPDIGLGDGINATRILIPKLWFDREKCELGIEGLKSYTRAKSRELVDPNGNPVYTEAPAKGWPNHPADALRMGAVGLPSLNIGDVPVSMNPPRAIV
jgi:hypothetical protein